MNNAEKIKELIENKEYEELAQLFVFDEDGEERASCAICAFKNDCCDLCYHGVIEWLKSEQISK